MIDFKQEADTKIKAELDEKKISYEQEEIDKFLDTIKPNVDLIFKIQEKKLEDYEVVVTHDKNSKHKVPVLLTFVRKSKSLVK